MSGNAQRKGDPNIALAGFRRCVLTTLLLSLYGCGGQSTATVTGHVTCKGQPLTSGTITFVPASGRASVGDIQADGSYKLSNIAIVGSHVVTIEAFESDGTEPLPRSFNEEMNNPKALTSGGLAPKIVWLAPEKYADRLTTPLRANIEAGKSNEIDFDL